MKHFVLFFITLTSFVPSIAQTFWQRTNLDSGRVTCFAINPSTQNIYAGTYNGVFYSTDLGDNWIKINSYQTASICIDSSGYIYAGTLSQGIFRSSDNGNNWIQVNNGLPIDVGSIHTFLVGLGNHLFVGTDRGVYRSTNNGDQWTLVGFDSPYIDIVCFALAHNNHIIAGNSNGAGGIYKSIDNGSTWILTGPEYKLFHSLAVHPNGTVYAGINGGVNISNGLYLSTDNGSSWLLITSYTPHFAWSIGINSSGDIFTASLDPSDIFYSTNNGTNWFSTNFYTGWCVLIIDSNGYIYAGTADGVYRSIQSTITSINTNSNNEIFSKFVLNQNYPNPFNPMTTINYSVPKPSYVAITVYDELGREINSLVNEEKFIGNYSIEFNATSLSSGIYFYQMKTDEFIETKKMLLLK